MRDITLEELLSAGCHFGHQVNRRNPKADEFIFEERTGVHIIDLGKTREGLLRAAEFVKELASTGGYLILVGTKRQAKGIIKEEVERVLRHFIPQDKPAKNEAPEGRKALFYVTSRWIGGTLTNFPEVSKNFKKLKELNLFLSSGKTAEYTKREVLLFERERNKLKELYEGIADLDRIPDALFVIDTHLETTAVREAQKMGVRLLGIVDTNADPSIIDYPIPANDDAVGSIKLIVSYLIDAWLEGKKKGIKNQESGIMDNEEKKNGKQLKRRVKKKESSNELKEPMNPNS